MDNLSMSVFYLNKFLGGKNMKKQKICRIGRLLTSFILTTTILFSTIATPIQAVADTMDSETQTEKAVNEESSKESNKINLKEEVRDQPKLVDSQGNLYDPDGNKTSTIDNEQNDLWKTIEEEVQKEAKKIKEDTKLPATFDEVDMNDSESILLALINPNFPFISSEEVFKPKKKASEQMETYKKSKDWFLVRYNDLTNGENAKLAKAISGGILTVEEINPPTGYSWIAIQTHGGTAGFTHDKFYKFKIGGNILFCIEPGKTAAVGGNHSAVSLDSLVGATKAKHLTAMADYGWYGQKDYSDLRYVAVQLSLWGYLGDKLQDITPLWKSTISSIMSDIKSNYNKLLVKPSFNEQVQTIKVGQTATFTDTNNSLSNVRVVSAPNGITATISGNTLKVTASTSAPDTASIYLGKGSYGSENAAFVCGNYQKLGLLNYWDPSVARVKVNVQKKGNLKIKKVDAETGKAISGTKFKLSYGGKQVEFVTNANGECDLKDIDAESEVVIDEVQAADGYVLNKTPQKVKIKANETVTVTFKNKKQVGRLDLVKEDKETGNQAQGAATLDGAVYGLFETDGKKVKEVTLEKSGDKVTGSFENIQIMHDYYVQEIKAPAGYVLDSTKYPVNIDYAGQDKEIAVKSSTVKDQVIKGGFDLIKTGNYDWTTNAWNWITGKDPSDQPTVLKDVEFTVTQDFGNRDIVAKKVTDEQGYVSFDDLPYGTYVVSETKTPTGYQKVKDFKVTISEDGQRFHYVVENKVKEAKVKFVKVDSETGKTIVRLNAGFEIYSKTTGEQLIMKDLQGKEQSIFYTDENGILQLPTQFAFGKYYAKEVKAPEGYVLAKNTIDFEVTGDEKDGIVVVTIKNDNQKGQLTLHKTVQTAMSIVEKESEYGTYSEIQFDQGNGEGFSFKIRPTEDIVTADGTIRFKAGEFLQKDGNAQVWTTDNNGEFQTDPCLYIGKYEAVEVQAPAGVNLQDVKPIPFEITYAGQNVDITSTTATAENYLQEINLYGHKQQEVVTGWEEGKAVVELENANNGQVFALKTGQELQIGETTLKSDTPLGYAVVKDGVISFENLLLPNIQADYYLEEVDAGSDHVLNKEQYFFTYTPATNDREHEIHVWADSYAENKQAFTRIARKPILNELARATVKLVKTDDLDGQALENVAFDLVRIDSITNENGEETKKETVISKHATNAAGEIIVENLPAGNYKFVESRPLDWYEDNTDDLSFTVTPKEDGTVIEVKAVNYRKPLEITTKFATTKDGLKQVNPDIDNELTDYVAVDGMKPGHTYTVDTAYVNRDTKEVVSTSTSEITTDKEGTFEFTTELSLPKGTLKDSTRLTATHVVYEDKDKTKEIGRHDDLENEDQTVIFKEPKVSIKTKAHTGDNKTQTFTHGDIINVYDNVDLSHENVLDGTERAFEAILVAQTPDGKMADIWTSGKINYVVNDSTIVKQVKTQVDTSKYPEGTVFFFKEVGYNEAGEKDCEHNFDGKDKQQALTPKRTLPKTGEVNSLRLTMAGLLLLFVCAGIVVFVRRKSHK